MSPDSPSARNRQEVTVDPKQLILAPMELVILDEEPPPRQFEWYTWTEEIEPAIQAQTPAFRDAFLDLLHVARDRHQEATGKPPRFLTLRQPPAILGPKWTLHKTGNYGAFDSLWVLRDPKLGPSEFGLAY